MVANRRIHFPMRPNPFIAIVGVPQPNDSFTFSSHFDLGGLQLVGLAEVNVDGLLVMAIHLYKFFMQPLNSLLTIGRNEGILIILKTVGYNLNNNISGREKKYLTRFDDYNIKTTDL